MHGLCKDDKLFSKGMTRNVYQSIANMMKIFWHHFLNSNDDIFEIVGTRIHVANENALPC